MSKWVAVAILLLGVGAGAARAEAPPDPWVVCERTVAQDAAGARTLAEKSQDARLVAYVAWRAAHPLPKHAWRDYERVQALRARRRHAEARAQLAQVQAPDDGVLGVLFGIERAYVSSDPRAAVASAQAAARGAATLGWQQGQRRALSIVVELGHRLRKHDLVVEVGPALLALLPPGDVRDRHHVHRRIGAAHAARGESAKAAAHARHALAAARNRTQRRNATRALAMHDAARRPLHEQREILIQLRALEDALGNAAGTAATDAKLATVEVRMGRWASALARIERALAHFEQRGKPWEVRGAHLQAALITLEMRDTERARAHVAKAREAGRALDLDDTPLAHIDAVVRSRRGDRAGAIKAYARVLELGTRLSKDERAAIWIHRATEEIRARRFEDARASLAKAGVLMGEHARATRRVHLLATESLLYAALGDRARAVARAQEARAVRGDVLPGFVEIVDTRLAEGLSSQSAHAEALTAAERAIDRMLRRSATLPERLGTQHRSEFEPLCALGIASAYHLGAWDRMFAVAERLRAVALRNRLGGPKAALDMFDPELLAQERALRRDERAAMARLRAEEAPGEAMKRLESVRARLDRHRERMHVAHAAAAQMIDPKVLRLADVRKALAANHAHVQYVQGAQHLIALVVTHDTVRAVSLGKPLAVRQVLTGVVLEDPHAPWKADWSRLHEAVIAPLGLPSGIEHVSIVPTGQLESVPFQALLPKRAVTLIPSATVGRLLRAQQAPPGQSVLGVAAATARDLPAARAEVQAVADVRVVGTEATQEGVEQAIASRARWRALHFACHGLIDVERPMRSALSLAAGPRDDGQWTVGEILMSAVPADVVVLAACSSAQGRTFAQEGRVGFVHAFLVAGARHVVATLWDVDDAASSAFSLAFHSALAAGRSPSAAVRSAQRTLREDVRWAHPAHWAGWQVWGPRN